MSFAFWQALIDTQAIGERAGWLPIFVLVYRTESMGQEATNDTNIEPVDISQAVAAVPVFVKDHHRGEFVFDHAWAQAYARYGLDYYSFGDKLSLYPNYGTALMVGGW
jgi:predicted N-acyltransferase